ncbi:MAG: trans-sulfuration enzyme family protein [Candidatus Longimicrobiales bacterium M2_2A_002]
MSEPSEPQRFATRAIHAGQRPDPTTGAIMPPVYQTSTYVQPALGEPKEGYEYARVTNPTRDALQANIASLEGARYGAAFGSGIAAIEAIVKKLSAGDHVVSEENTYGGTTRMFDTVLARLGIEFTYVDSRSTDAIRDAIRPETKLIHLETPTNPMMRLCDLAAAAELGRERGITTVVDNTFASPYNQRPLELGIDVVVHSTTKYLNGHSDVVGGMVLTSDDEWAEHLYYMQKAAGAVPGPMDCWLTLRGTKTLAVRMEAHNRNGLMMAEFLADHTKVETVNYPGLPSHPQHELARKQMKGFTGMISMDVGSLERARAIVEGTRIFSLAESLGGVESLIGHPAMQTHAAVAPDRRNAMGITDGLVRLSVGIEDPDDLIDDVARALDGAP